MSLESACFRDLVRHFIFPLLQNVRLSFSIQLAKKYGGGQAFGNFCNAVLRKLPPDPRFDNDDRLARRDQAKATAGEEEAQGVGGEANMRRLPFCEVRSIYYI